MYGTNQVGNNMLKLCSVLQAATKEDVFEVQLAQHVYCASWTINTVVHKSQPQLICMHMYYCYHSKTDLSVSGCA